MLIKRIKQKYISGIIVEYIDHNGIMVEKFYPVSFRRYKKEIKKRLNYGNYRRLELCEK